MSMSRWSVMAAAGLGLLAGACGRTGRMGEGSEVSVAVSPRAEAPVVQVTNRHWQDVNVFLLLGGTRYRLGTVSTSHTDRFSISRYAGWDTHRMQLYVDPIGSTDSYTSAEFTLDNGQWADCVVEGTLSLSSYMIRNY